jgi:hypothetical protein
LPRRWAMSAIVTRSSGSTKRTESPTLSTSWIAERRAVWKVSALRWKEPNPFPSTEPKVASSHPAS